MCGRYILYTDDEQKEIRSIVDEVNRKHNVELKKGDIYPSQVAPVYWAQEGQMTLDLMKWGYRIPTMKRLIINARSETVTEKRLFKKDFQEHRCLIPATGFYEWDKNKSKHLFSGDEPLIYMGGIFRENVESKEFSILTHESSGPVAAIHDRMPVIIAKEHLIDFLNDEQAASELLSMVLPLTDTVQSDEQLTLF